MKRFRPRNVRTRLTLWYVTVLAGVLLIYGISSSALSLFQLRRQLDDLAIEDLETVEGFLSFDSKGKLILRNDHHDHPYPATMLERFMEVRAENGILLYRSESLENRALAGIPDPEEGVGSYSPRSIRLSDGTRVRVVSKRHMIEGRPTLIRVGFSEEVMWQGFRRSTFSLIAGLPLALALVGVGGYFLAKHALSPIARMARRAHEINGERLSARLDVENPVDELGLLARSFNETLSRLESSFEQLRRFTSDVSHELRTPLTAIRSVGEVGLQKQGGIEHYREVIGSMLEETGRLSHLVDSLLMVARGDAGQIKPERTSIPILPLVREAVSLLEVLAEEKDQKLSLAGDNSAEVRVDRAILRQVLINLLDNAIKHSPNAATVSIRVFQRDNQTVAVEVEDSGPGIPAEHRDKVFNRFYRVDKGRSRQTGGAGLGLAIAKWGAEAHGGRLELDCPARGGCIFRLLLPPSGSNNENRATLPDEGGNRFLAQQALRERQRDACTQGAASERTS
ncbi:MAG: HAMP domain-containing protein [Acidobacteriia bacterium]|nr:HAMP domain-containing protein [Terriglobia bacterium]